MEAAGIEPAQGSRGHTQALGPSGDAAEMSPRAG
jgi:hypothetical protein